MTAVAGLTLATCGIPLESEHGTVIAEFQMSPKADMPEIILGNKGGLA